MDIFFEELLKTKNKVIIGKEYDPSNHLILSKYISKAYYNYTIKLLQTLLEKSEYINKSHIFYMSLNYLLRILYNFKNNAYIDNYDLLILSSFSLGIKASVDQHKTPFITKLKKIYPEKFSIYANNKIQECEVICMKFLDYNINILTPYECLYYLFNKDINKFPLLINELNNIIFNNVNTILFQNPYELALEAINKFNAKIQNLKPPIFISKKTAPFLNKKNKKIYNESSPTTSVSSSYGSYNNTRNNFNSKRLKGIRSQSNMDNNNKNVINNINKELNDINKYNCFMIKRCNNSVSRETNNNKNNSISNDNNNEIKKIIYKNYNYNFNNDKTVIKICENNKTNNNIKILKNYENKNSSKGIIIGYMNTSANKNTSPRNIKENLQKMEINKFLCFSSKKSPLKANSRINVINFSNNTKVKIDVKNSKLLNNLSSNNIKNTRIQNESGNTIFKKPTIDKQKMKTTFKNKNITKNNKNYKKEISFNSALKNCNIHYRKITDLCKKINFDVFNNISDKDKSHK